METGKTRPATETEDLPSQSGAMPELVVVRTAELDGPAREAARALLVDVFEG